MDFGSDFNPSTTVWFDDGNVVLASEDTAFCVYRGVLSRSSAVFQDMFQVPQPESMETFRGVPLVRLSDSKLEVEYFLQALFDTSWTLRYFNKETHSFPVVSAVLRLSTKYSVQSLRKRSIQLLCKAFPSKLKDFEPPQSKQEPNRPWYYALRWTGWEGDALRLARECRIPIIEPTLLYRCCLYSTDDVLQGILKGHDNEDGHLDVGDRLRCLGRKCFLYENLRSYYTAAFLYVAETKECRSPDICSHVRLDLIRIMEQEISQHNCCHFLELRPEMNWPKLEDMCYLCEERALIEYAKSRDTLWDEIPAIFMLGTWSTLRESMEEELDEDDEEL